MTGNMDKAAKNENAALALAALPLANVANGYDEEIDDDSLLVGPFPLRYFRALRSALRMASSAALPHLGAQREEIALALARCECVESDPNWTELTPMWRDHYLAMADAILSLPTVQGQAWMPIETAAKFHDEKAAYFLQKENYSLARGDTESAAWYSIIAGVHVKSAIAIRALPTWQAWRSIESAPKDGSYVLFYFPSAEKPSVAQVYWDAYYAPKGRGHNGGSGWIVAFASEDVRLHYSVEPTHWMPLPPSPLRLHQI